MLVRYPRSCAGLSFALTLAFARPATAQTNDVAPIAIHAEPAAGSSIPAATEYLRPGTGRASLVIESSGPSMEIIESFGRDVARENLPGLQIALEPLCRTPCTLYVEPGTFTFRARAPHYRPLRETVTVPPSGLRIRLRAATVMRHWASVGTIMSGAGSLVVGAALASVAAIYNDRLHSGAYDGLAGAGIVTGVVGFAAMITGIVLLGSIRDGVESSTAVSVAPTANGFAASFTARF